MRKKTKTMEERAVQMASIVIAVCLVLLINWLGLSLLLGHATFAQAVGVSFIEMLAGWVFDAAKGVNQ